MKGFLKFLRNHFGFKTLEINGFVGLVIMMLFFLFVNVASRENLFFNNPNTDYLAEDKRIVEELVPLLEQKYKEKSQAKNRKYKKNKYQNTKLFAFNPNKIDSKTWQQLGLKKYLAERIVKYRSKGGSFKKKEDLLKIYGFPKDLFQKMENFINLPTASQNYKSAEKTENYTQKDIVEEVELFAFNPNKIDSQTWQKLGLKKYLAERIVKYRTKGGSFKKKEDLLKIYGFPEKLYQQLEGFIVIEETEQNPSQTTDNQLDTGKKEKYYKTEIQKFDINQADTSTLKQIRGIGSYFAKKIIEHREKLGGFYKMEQLKEVWNLKPETFEKLAEYAFIEKNYEPQKININTVSQEELKKHIYITYKLANTIVNYREQHGAYKKVSDLSKIHSINAQLLQKIRPYLKIE